MPLEIKDKRTKKVKACAVAGNSLKCGHCFTEIKHNHRWLALDDPYYCLIHETCLTMFDFNGKDRLIHSEGSQEAQRKMDGMVLTLNNMISRPWFQKTKAITPERKRALQQLLLVHQSIRTAGVLNQSHEERATEALIGYKESEWFKNIPEEQKKALMVVLSLFHVNKE